MVRTVCQAAKQGIVKQRGIPSIEWYKDGVPQYYCSGYLDEATDELMKVCWNCPDYAGHAYEDHENWKEERGKRKMDKRKYTIYATDFDGTLCESIFPGIGSPNMALINHLIKRRKQGNKIILWTCRINERLQEAVEWCRQYGLEFDAVNENLPEMVEFWGGESRKVFADVYIDDKAVNKPKYCVPYKEVVE